MVLEKVTWYHHSDLMCDFVSLKINARLILAMVVHVQLKREHILHAHAQLKHMETPAKSVG